MDDLNRIYQGRATALELATGDKANPWRTVKAVEAQTSDAPLWTHHSLFQSATNYYLLALAAMVDGDGNGLLVTLRKQIEACWSIVEHRKGEGFQSVKQSVSRYLKLPENATAEHAFAKILDGNAVDRTVLDGAVTNLADQLAAGKGGANVQQLGRGEFPKFCTPSCTANFAGDPLILRRDYHQKLLPWMLYFQEGLTPESSELAEFDVYSIATPNRKEMMKDGAKSKALLKSAVKELRAAYPKRDEDFDLLLDKIKELNEETLETQNYVGSSAKGVVKLRLFALFLFNHVEKNEFTLGLLRETHLEPAKDKPEAPVIDADAIDPLQKARGERGFVFPAFTALSDWKPEKRGDPQWTEFDIDAFKEALKTLNQFRQKTKERQTLQGRQMNLRRWIDEKDEDALKNSVDKSQDKTEAEADEEGGRNFTFEGDERIGKIKKLVEQLVAKGEEILPQLDDDSDKPKTWKISFGTLRKFWDLRDEWNRIYKAAKGSPEQLDLEEAVKDKQRQDRYGIGSVPLFLRLCEKDNWDLWRELTLKEEAERAENDWPKSPLHAWAEYCDLVEEINRLGEPIRFTPAEPRRSRRLAMLSNYTGKSKTVFGNDTEKGRYVEVSLAVEEGGRIVEKRARIFYAAKRMHRDGIPMGDPDQRWIQPMVEAFGFDPPEKPMLKKAPAVALMPQFGRLKGNETVRMLLNFPVQVNPGWLVDKIAKNRWKNTTKEGRDLEIAAQWMGWTNYNNHIHWGAADPKTGTFKTTKLAGHAFHEDSDIQKNGFSVLSFDLGQRDAGGFAVLETRCDGGEFFRKRKPIHTIGIDDAGREWKTAAVDFGMFKLPGEDAQVYRPKSRADIDSMTNKAFRTELYGEAGRNASPKEWQAAREMAVRRGMSMENAPRRRRTKFKSGHTRSCCERWKI